MTTPSKLQQQIWWTSAAWTVLGLAPCAYNCELNRQTGRTGFTQLAVSHTHTLILDIIVSLILLALVHVSPFDPSATRRLVVVYSIGAALRVVMLSVKGTLQAMDLEFANSPALSGAPGLGHVILSGAFAHLFVLLRRALNLDTTEQTAS